ncbi:MAG: ferrous iron transport protein A [Eubacteriales bacterium]|nr:ferrous iron transport protein A [Eubacteriales bacterium]
MTLDELKAGQTAVIRAVGGVGALRLRLLDMGLIPRTKVTLIKAAPMGDPIEICVRGYELTLRKDDARSIALAEGEENKDDLCACGESELGKNDAVQCAYGVQTACRKLSGRDGGSESGRGSRGKGRGGR